MVEMGVGVLVRTRWDAGSGEEDEAQGDAGGPSRSAAVEEYRRRQEESYSEQSKMAAEERRRRLEHLQEHIARGRESKRQRRERKKGDVGMAVPPSGDSRGPPENPCPTPGLPREAMMVQIATARPVAAGEAEEVDWHVASRDWPYPGREDYEVRYKVFKDLWERGYYITSGGKFGGDFLVYPGDPMRFHSHYVAVCYPEVEEISPLDIASLGRLGSNVKKTLLLCSVNESGEVFYTSLQWTGMQ
nr:PREDICTED: tRNA-splicing endonuclease subunit Sen34 [Latimeria chalumnae]|eukprot:XP_014346678.1 PREDICTED: tRNA-splicing endonuclease subunit Sen34 [Latimeria chalumnae]